MMSGKGMKTINLFFLLINIAIVMGISLFLYITTEKICYEDNGREFIQQVKSIPHSPISICIISFCLLVILSLDMVVRSRKEAGKIRYFSLVMDFICSLSLVYLLDFNYNGILLLVFANLIVYTRDTKVKFMLVGIAMITYLVANHDLISISYPLFSIGDYIGYYNKTKQQIILGIYNILESMNILIFILYCINIINTQKNRIEEVNEWYKQLQSANEQLREYHKVVEKMVETRERNRVAREIHDTLGHTLTGVSAGVDACIELLEIDPNQTKKQLEIIAKAVRGGIKEVRRSVSELRVDGLEHTRLDEAIKTMIEDMNSLTGVEVQFQSEVHPFSFSQDEENVIYRIIQEGMTNAVRHGKATKIFIHAKKIGGVLYLHIKDNGKGCGNIKKGFGTKHMKERVEMLGGIISFDGSDGFLIDAQIPIRWGKEYDKSINS